MTSNDTQELWTIPITEFVLPNGVRHERRLMLTDASNRAEIEEILKLDDVRFETERLRTGEVSFTVTHREFGDLSSVLLPVEREDDSGNNQGKFFEWFNGLSAVNIHDIIERHQLEDAEDDDTETVLSTDEGDQATDHAEDKE